MKTDTPANSENPEPAGLRQAFAAWPGRCLLAGLFGAACFALRRFGVEGGDTGALLGTYMSYLWGPHYAYLRREPLAHAVVFAVSRVVEDKMLVFSIVGAVCGVLYLFLLLGRSRRLLFLLPSAVSALPVVFIGHAEFYAPVAVVLTAFFLALWRALEPAPRGHPGWVCASFALAFLTHKIAFIFIPLLALLHLRYRPRWSWSRRTWPARFWGWGIGALLLVAGIDLMAPFIAEFRLFGISMLYVYDSDPLLIWLTPLTGGMQRWLEAKSILGARFHFTFGQSAHWLHFFGCVALSAPLAWPVIIALRRRLRGDAAWALLGGALIGLAWTFMWHPHQGWLDWDMFALASIPANLLAGGLLADLFRADAQAAEAAAAP